MRIPRLALIAALALASPGPVRAADGTIDLLIAPDTASGISAPGSYRVVDDVTLTANITAITVTADNVTIDLGGHTITGAVTNFQLGIRATGRKNVTVMNGNIIGMGDSAIELGPRGVIRNVRAEGNNTAGGNAVLAVGDGSLVEACVVSGNSPATGAVVGIDAGNDCRVIGNIVAGNVSPDSSSRGIVVKVGSTVEGNTVKGNKSVSFGGHGGIFGEQRCIMRGNVVSDNDNAGTGSAAGIVSTNGSLIEGNTCSDHDTGATGSGTCRGIYGYAATIVGNVCVNNRAQFGSTGTARAIDGGVGSTIERNTCKETYGSQTVTGASIYVEGNSVIVGNRCMITGGGLTPGWGIRVAGNDCYVAENYTSYSKTAGLSFSSGTDNRTERNRFREDVGLDPADATPESQGMNELQDLTY